MLLIGNLRLCKKNGFYPVEQIKLLSSLQGGSIIRLFHKELEAYMVAEGLFDDEVTEDGMLCC
jgi:hypothetical protein